MSSLTSNISVAFPTPQTEPHCQKGKVSRSEGYICTFCTGIHMYLTCAAATRNVWIIGSVANFFLMGPQCAYKLKIKSAYSSACNKKNICLALQCIEKEEVGCVFVP
ncbi:TPA: hypothetical protein GDO54_018628 [Pyxicephalus adspersus]|uniref:Uncharacterized protein n=1 Tax=Pyxicephalus adspersus TaxID=30357 RepID=A0AAV2ZIJ4_PYXAD|nr:TPA: hypothetical protein GDO54_018628 [Pyxicephalus adspersus]